MSIDKNYNLVLLPTIVYNNTQSGVIKFHNTSNAITATEIIENEDPKKTR